LAPLAQKFQQPSAPKAEQRPHHLAQHPPLLLEDNPRMNTRKSPNPGTTKNTEQHRLRLIVKRVGRSNFRNAAVPRQLAEKIVTQFARRRLHAGTDAAL